VKIHPRNEALDCAVYALGAYALLNPNLDRVKENFLAGLPKPEETVNEETGEITLAPVEQTGEPDRKPDKVAPPRVIPKVAKRPNRPPGWVNNWR